MVDLVGGYDERPISLAIVIMNRHLRPLSGGWKNMPKKTSVKCVNQMRKSGKRPLAPNRS